MRQKIDEAFRSATIRKVIDFSRQAQENAKYLIKNYELDLLVTVGNYLTTTHDSWFHIRTEPGCELSDKLISQVIKYMDMDLAIANEELRQIECAKLFVRPGGIILVKTEKFCIIRV